MQLAEDLREVVLDGSRTQKHPGRYFVVGQALTDQTRDLRFLRSKHGWSDRAGLTNLGTRGAQFPGCSIRESRRADALEEFEGMRKMEAGVGEAPLTAQPLAVYEPRASEVETGPPAFQAVYTALDFGASARSSTASASASSPSGDPRRS